VGLLISYTNKGENRNVLQNPLIIIATKYSEIYKKYCNEFGLTPNSRIKLTITKRFEKEDSLVVKGFNNV
jgi:P27 family predicted phage terminase small subunit